MRAFICDWCGDEITDGAYVTLTAEAEPASIYTSGNIAHYHASEALDCLESVQENVLEPAHEWGRALAELPIADPEAPKTGSPTRRPPIKGNLDVSQAVKHPPSASSLRRNGIRTLEEAAERTEFDLLMMERVGEQTVESLKVALANHGLALRPGPDRGEVGGRLRQLRLEHGLSQREVARSIDEGTQSLGFTRYAVHQGAIAAWESGRAVPARRWVDRLASLFKFQSTIYSEKPPNPQGSNDNCHTHSKPRTRGERSQGDVSPWPDQGAAGSRPGRRRRRD